MQYQLFGFCRRTGGSRHPDDFELRGFRVALAIASLPLTPFDSLVCRFDIARKSFLARPAGVLRHFDLFFDLVQRFALFYQLADPLQQERIIFFRVLEYFHGAGLAVSGNHVLRVQCFHHLGRRENIGNSHERTQNVDLIDNNAGSRK